MKRSLTVLLLLLLVETSFGIQIHHIGVNDGLSQISVLSIQQDRIGRVWLGTEEGLNVYDGSKVNSYQAKDKIDSYTPAGEYSVLGNQNHAITLGDDDHLYFISDGSLIKYNTKLQQFSKIEESTVTAIATYKEAIWYTTNDSICYIKNDSTYTYGALPYSMKVQQLLLEDSAIWLGSTYGLYKIDRGSKTSTIIPRINITALYRDSYSNLWVGSADNGLYQITSKNQVIHHKQKESTKDKGVLKNNRIRCFVEDDYNQLWIGTFKGLSTFDIKKNQFIPCEITIGQEGISHSSIFSLMKDYQGNIWVGTYYGGANYFHPKKDIFKYYRSTSDSRIFDNKHLSYPFVGSMVEDNNSNLWICTEGGGLNSLNRNTGRFEQYDLIWNANNEEFKHKNLKAIVHDSISNQLFIGTHTGGLTSFDLKTKRFKYFYLDSPHYAQRLGNVVDNLIIHNRQLFIQIRGGVYTMNLDEKEPKFNPLFNDKRFENYWIRTFYIDSSNYIWIAGHNELVRIQLEDIKNLKRFDPKKYKIGKFRITKIHEDSQNNVFIGTRGSGIFKYDKEKDSFINYTQENNKLLSNYCYDMQNTRKGTLIVLGNKGISLLTPNQSQAEFISLENTLPLSSFNLGSKIYVCRDGEIYIGGIDGMIAFQEDNLSHEYNQNHLYFSQLYIHNQLVLPNDNNKVLHNTLPLTAEIELSSKQRNISLHFASNNYIKTSQGGIYEYKLEGVDKDWITTTSHTINYNNLETGNYKLSVREKGGLLTKQTTPQLAELNIKILPPFYNTWWFRTLYILVILGVVYSLVQFYLTQLKLKTTLQIERDKQEQIKRWDKIKTNFFTTISHEFRTPLTLIISQIEMLLKQSNIQPSIYNSIQRIQYNAQNMRELASELLVFQKLDLKHFTLSVNKVDLADLISKISASFTDLATTNEIKYTLNIPNEEVPCWIDINSCKKIVFNLLSNAFKYTSQGDSIEVNLTTTKDSIVLQVIDNGKGIAEEDQKRIFDLFYRTDEEVKKDYSFSVGSGIGLSLVKQLVEQHQGSIHLKSALGYGSVFTINFKKGYQHFENDKQIVLNREESITTSYHEPKQITPLYKKIQKEDNGTQTQKNYSILIVEDNTQILQMLEELFSPIYTVYTAVNGVEGYEKACEHKPHLILSDILMPKMTGYELCWKVKNNLDLSHIPVVLLTALCSEEDQNKGFSQRADDYIAKPFNPNQLIIRCNNLIQNRIQLQQRFIQDYNKNSDDSENTHILATSALDLEFLNKVNEIIDRNISNEEFDIDSLAEEMFIGRSSFYIKFKALSGLSPNEYLTTYRLKRAAHLLRTESQLQIADIAYAVGYSSPRYFSRCFRKFYNTSPSEFRKGDS